MVFCILIKFFYKNKLSATLSRFGILSQLFSFFFMTMFTDKELSLLQDVELCVAAIKSTDLLSNTQKEIFQHMLRFSQDRGVTAASIKVKLGITRQAAAIHLKRLMQRNFITREKNRVFVYKINLQELLNLIKDHKTNQ